MQKKITESDIKKLRSFKTYFEMICAAHGIDSAFVVFEFGEDIAKHHLCNGQGGVICQVNSAVTTALKKVYEHSVDLRNVIH